MRTVLMLGAGRMGGALLNGWMSVGPVSMDDVLILDPMPGEDALQAVESGATLDPSDEDLAKVDIVLVAVKPQIWREAVAAIEPRVPHRAIIVSIMAGVASADISQAFRGRFVARVMPTTAVAVAQGSASVYADDPAARDRALDLFSAVAQVVILPDEDLMHAATAVSGSGPAYLYAFVEALEAAAAAAGLAPEDARGLARSTVVGAAALMSLSEAEPAELRRQVTSPGGTTAAGLQVLTGEGELERLLTATVEAAAARSRELG